MDHQTDNAEPIASASDVPGVASTSLEVAQANEAVIGETALIAEPELARAFDATEAAISELEIDAAVEAQALIPPFEDAEVSCSSDAEWVMADALDTAAEEKTTDSWPQGRWETPSLEASRADVPMTVAPSQPSMQATAQSEVDAGQLESVEQPAALHYNATGHSAAALPSDGPFQESWATTSLEMAEAEGDDELEGEVDGGEEVEATPFDHLTGDRLAVLVERGPESLDALVVATEAQARAVEVLDGLARRLRSGDLAVVSGSGTSAESVLASILAALLSERS